MAKEKVYKLAQEFRVSSEALVQMLRGMGIPVKSHMSTVDENLRDQIKRKFEEQRAEIKKEYARKREMLKKKREDMLASAGTKQEEATPETPKPAPAEPPKKKVIAKPQSERPAQPSGGARRHAGRNMSQMTRHDKVFEPQQKSPFQEGQKPQKPSSGAGGDGRGKDKKRKKSNKRRPAPREVSTEELKSNVRKTLAKIGAGSTRKKYKKDGLKREEGEEQERKVLKVSEFVTAAEFANMIEVPVSEVIAKCLEMGLFVTINQRLDFETIELLSEEFGFKAELMEEYAEAEHEEIEQEEIGELKPRAPVVTVMGHVDHGKTSLLDYIRRTNVISGEAGGITQHIAAYEVPTSKGSVTFLDTPGHEAFTAMRARGSQITDVIVLVVAADSGVMPQTKEAIDHARAANVPLVIAINKVDLPTANIDRVKSELASYNVVVEDYGGQISCVEISAITGQNVDTLLETLALENEMLELKSSAEGKARGVVIEAELDRGRGPLATVLIQRGTLRRGDAFVTGIHNGKVRDLLNEVGKQVDEVGPSQPALVLGMSGTPQAGDSFRVVEEEKEAREISARRRLAQKERELRKIGTVSLDRLYEQIKSGNVQSLNLIIKGDVDGSVEALAESLTKLSTDEIKVNVIRKGVGAVKEADINLAAASNAIIVGFHLSPNSKIREFARREGVEIRTYRIIYEAVDEMRSAMEGMLAPEIKENVLGVAQVRDVFKISKVGAVAGCHIESGTVTRNAKARVIREDVEIVDTAVTSLRRHKNDVREVNTGYECGITLKSYNDVKVGDRIEVYEEVEVARKLS